ncbi:MAG: UDP-N-acetylmuramoyl-L-alanyl-D-glutamate--2,6-diaminopimelate ligase [Xanthomonadales bacterium]|nr:UDP-N-acetylmuramoyl-L-alanyl-D-glutamate--2,6-diaminopimelate ligase [Xanthomonadales bacterium]
MSETTLADLLALVGLPADVGAAAIPVRGVALDTRELRPGDVFLALRGAQDHGYRHAGSAVACGAVAVLAEAPLPGELALPVPVYVAPDLRSRLARFAMRVYRSADAPPVIAVTGTNGKTSSVQFIAAGAALLGRRPATQGTLGAGPLGQLAPGTRTTPDVCANHRFLADMRAAGCDLVAMEVSSHALVQGRVDGLRFDVAVYTQLSRDHLDYHGDMQAYFEAKARLFAWPGLRHAVINLDCPRGRELARRSTAPVTGYSARGESAAALAAEDVELGHAGIGFTLRLHGERRPLRSPLLGRFNVDNLLAACGALSALGADIDALARILPQLQPVPGRMNRLGGGKQPLVVVDYAHTPDAIEKALASLREHAPRRLAIVFGCGGERDRGKRPLMAAAAQAGADEVWLTDDNPRGEDGDAIVAETRAGFARPQAVRIERDRRRAIAGATAPAAAGDIVLIAGKGHEAYQEIAGRKLPFDDREVAAAVLAGRAA